MNYFWILSAIICFATALLHTIGGQFEIVRPLIKSELKPVPKGVMHACWHMVTIVLFGSSFALAWIGMATYKEGFQILAAVIGVQFIGFSIVFLFLTLRESGKKKLLILPQWILLLPIGILSILGLAQYSSTH